LRQKLCSDDANPSGWIAYLCLQVTREGQASYAHVHEIINGLQAEGLDVRLYQPAFSKVRESHPLMRVLEFMKTQVRLWRASPRPALIYCRAHVLAFPTAIWARWRGIPVIQEVNGPDSDLYLAWPVLRPFRPVLSRMVPWQYRSADAVIVVTEALAEWVRSWSGQMNVHVVENGANTEVFRPEAALSDTGLGTYVVFFGALAPWQGIEHLIRAVECPQWPDGVGLVIIGDGACRDLAASASQKLAAVTYLGRQSYQAVPGYVAAAMASVIPKTDLAGRRATGLSPLKLYESIACGVPVVVTDIPGQSDFVRAADCGLVVPPGDAEAIASAVERLFRDSALRDRLANNALSVAHRVSWRERAKDTHRVISSIIGPDGHLEESRTR